MFLLNLSLAQFLGASARCAAVVVALYLLDRSRRRQVVSTLRFWSDRRDSLGRRTAPANPAALVPAAATG